MCSAAMVQRCNHSALESAGGNVSQETQSSSGSTSSNSHQALEEKWDRVRSKIKAKWHDLTDSDLSAIDGDSRKLVAMISQKTHMPISEIEQSIDEIAAGSEGLLSRISDVAGEYAGRVSEAFAEPARQVYQQVSRTVRSQPLPSVGCAFASGLAIGVLTYALAMSDDDHHHRRAHWYW